jgi:diguanylate cyclase (GGDEF)-like protein
VTTIVTAGVGGALVALVALLAFAVVRRSNRRHRRAAAELNARIETMGNELSTALERAEAESHRGKTLDTLVGSIDLDAVLARTLEAARGLEGVDATVVSLATLEGKPFVATLGLSQEEAQAQAITGPPDGRPARAVTIRYRYAGDEVLEDANTLHAGLAVPLHGELGHLGWLTVFTRSGTRELGDEDLLELESLALRAGPAIENARRFREARQLADLDSLTGLHNRRYFHEVLARECARARRYGRQLALVVLDVDDFKAVNDRIGHLAGDAALAETAARIRDVVRSADVACRVGGDEFAIVLPESSLADAERLFSRILDAVSGRPVGDAVRLLLSAGVAELRENDDATTLFQRADDALYGAKEAGKGIAVRASA